MKHRCKLSEERIRIHIMENSKETKTYHDKRPQFRNKGPSKLRQQFGKGMTAFLVVAASIVFYFAFLRFNGISNIFEKIFQILKTNYIWSCDCISSESDCEIGGKTSYSFFGEKTKEKRDGT